jgi:hypothetical protein
MDLPFCTLMHNAKIVSSKCGMSLVVLHSQNWIEIGLTYMIKM